MLLSLGMHGFTCFGINLTCRARLRMRGIRLLLVLCLHHTFAQAWRIPASSVKYQILEGSPVGSVLGVVSEQNSNKGLSFSFGAPSQLFHVHMLTSELTLKAELDAEKLCALANRRGETDVGNENRKSPRS